MVIELNDEDADEENLQVKTIRGPIVQTPRKAVNLHRPSLPDFAESTTRYEATNFDREQNARDDARPRHLPSAFDTANSYVTQRPALLTSSLLPDGQNCRQADNVMTQKSTYDASDSCRIHESAPSYVVSNTAAQSSRWEKILHHDEMEHNIYLLKLQQDNLQSRNESLQSQCAELSNRVMMLRDDEARISNQRSDLEGDVDHLRRAKSDLISDIGKLREEKLDLNCDVARARSALRDSVQNYKQVRLALQEVAAKSPGPEQPSASIIDAPENAKIYPSPATEPDYVKSPASKAHSVAPSKDVEHAIAVGTKDLANTQSSYLKRSAAVNANARMKRQSKEAHQLHLADRRGQSDRELLDELEEEKAAPDLPAAERKYRGKLDRLESEHLPVPQDCATTAAWTKLFNTLQVNTHLDDHHLYRHASLSGDKEVIQMMSPPHIMIEPGQDYFAQVERVLKGLPDVLQLGCGREGFVARISSNCFKSILLHRSVPFKELASVSRPVGQWITLHPRVPSDVPATLPFDSGIEKWISKMKVDKSLTQGGGTWQLRFRLRHNAAVALKSFFMDGYDLGLTKRWRADFDEFNQPFATA
ncbi:hypothetical protein PYCC9005_001798 [Savitreella phatthalungensis]